MTTFNQLIQALDVLYPPELAESWDQVGLHFGHPNNKIEKIMTALDVRPSTVDEAIDNGVDTLVVHHPPIFSSIDRFDYSNPQIEMYRQIIKYDLNVFAMHTNADRAHGGLADWLANQLRLEAIQSLEDDSVQPGLGRMGRLHKPMSRSEVIEYIKSVYQLPKLKIIEREPKGHYETVGFVGGSGSSFYPEAVAKEVDIFITGDVTYHTAHDIYETDLMCVDVGHYIEHLFTEKMAEVIDDLREKNDWSVEVITSQVSTNPYQYE